ncbi:MULTISPECIES: hypothetical protein [Clostridia]|uniref:hypothetical protein n=1 Tax=Clostridia TaxID=186801 RepID=UPI00067E96FD|nr:MULTISPECIES: hypothetical protein [Clostridia]
MALELVTGYWGQQHVTAEQDADLNAGIIGKEPCILNVGEKMKAEAVTANKVRIFDGVFVGYGRVCAIEEGAYEDVEIENGTAGLLRNDMIVMRYAKDEATGVEGVSLAVLKGQTGSTATDPTPNNQDIRAGAFESEMPLYRVRINGLAIEAVERICEMPRTIKDLTSLLGQLNSNWEKLGGLRFDHQFIASVTAEYSADNVLSFAGSQLYPGNFTNCAFLAVLNSTASTGKQSVYLIIMGAADAAPVLIKIDGGSEALYPKLAKTSSNRVYAVWSTAATAGIHTSLFKLY